MKAPRIGFARTGRASASSKPRSRRSFSILSTEALESRALLAVSPAGAALSPAAGTFFAGPVATFTASGSGPINPANYSAVIDWGDGTSYPGSIAVDGNRFEVIGVHTYQTGKTFAGSVTISDKSDSSSTPVPFTAAVSPRAKTVSLTTAVSTTAATPPQLTITAKPADIVEGQPFTGVLATFTSLDPNAVPSDFTATIHWGDGATTTGTVAEDVNKLFSVTGSHTFTEHGPYPQSEVFVLSRSGATATTAASKVLTLVSDGSVPAPNTDVQLKNPAGLDITTQGTVWVADQNTGVATLYNGKGVALQLSVTIPKPGGGTSTPTGIAFNARSATGAFAFGGMNSGFLFATQNGTIAAWGGGTDASTVIDNSASGAVYKGLAVDATGGVDRLYATNFHAGKVEVYDAHFAPIDLGTGAFVDPTLPAGFAPFNVRAIGGTIYVTYAKQDATASNDVPGAGNGYVDAYSATGAFLSRVASAGTLNSPYGIDFAPTTYKPFGGDVFVGNAGDGRISVFNPATGALVGQLGGSDGTPLTIDGLKGLRFGRPGTAAANSLFVTAGPNGGANGLVGRIDGLTDLVTVADAALTAQGLTVNVPEGVSSGPIVVATVTDANPFGVVGDLLATIVWGDGSTSPGTIAQSGGVGTPFTVTGSHVFLKEGAYPTQVLVSSNGGSSVSATGTVNAVDAKVVIAPLPVSATERTPLTNVPFATFTDPGGAEPAATYRAVIRFGDGTPDGIGTVSFANGVFTVAGSHTYAGQGTKAASIDVTTLGGSTTSAPVTVNVADVPIGTTIAGALTAASDTGVSSSDRITRDNTPTFAGKAQAGASIQLLVARQGTNAAPIVVGQTTADANGNWSITLSTLQDGVYDVSVTAVDPIDGSSAAVNLLPVAIDTVGPKVTAAIFRPSLGRVDITFQDLFAGLDLSSIVRSANYRFRSLTTATAAPSLSASLASNPTGPFRIDPYTVHLQINGGRALKSGKYLLSLLGIGITDLAGNGLDGGFSGAFPSGNGNAGADFRAILSSKGSTSFFPTVAPSTSGLISPSPAAQVAIGAGSHATMVRTARHHRVHDHALSTLTVSKAKRK